MDRGEPLKETLAELAEEPFNPKGHPPLVHVEGRIFRTHEGELVRSQWPLGPEPYHRDLFVEYERTFGRGLAKAASHGLAYAPIPQELKDQAKQIQDDYWPLASQVKRLSLTGTAEQIKEEIQKIRRYRAKYPALYSDVPDPHAPKPKITWK